MASWLCFSSFIYNTKKDKFHLCGTEFLVVHFGFFFGLKIESLFR